MPDLSGLPGEMFILDEGVHLDHIHSACLDKWEPQRVPKCCKCNGHQCNTLQCEIPGVDKLMVKKILAKMSIEVWFI